MDIATADAPRPGKRPTPPPAASQQAAATPTRSSAAPQADGDEIASILGAQPNGRQSSSSSTRQQRASGQNSRSSDISKGEKDAIAGLVGNQWNVDHQAADVPVVEVLVKIDAGGKLTSVEVADPSMRSNAAARAAVRAVYITFDQWPVPQGGWPDDTFRLVFDPKEMF
jgi:hypothetical protein